MERYGLPKLKILILDFLSKISLLSEINLNFFFSSLHLTDIEDAKQMRAFINFHMKTSPRYMVLPWNKIIMTVNLVNDFIAQNLEGT